MAVYAPALPGSIPYRHGFLRWLVSGGGLLILSLVFSLLSKLLQPGPVTCAPPSCRVPPPQQGPLSPPSRYTSSQYGYSLDYSTSRITPSRQDASSIAWDATLSDGSEVAWSFTGTAANRRSAEEIVRSAQGSNFPDAQMAYTIPGAAVGYTPCYGAVYDVSVSPGDGQAVHDRLILIAAIHGGVAVVLLGLGPYQQTTPDNDGHPNPADTPLVHLGDFSESLESVTWPGEPSL